MFTNWKNEAKEWKDTAELLSSLNDDNMSKLRCQENIICSMTKVIEALRVDVGSLLNEFEKLSENPPEYSFKNPIVEEFKRKWGFNSIFPETVERIKRELE